jgi:FkbM family methyltransferase
MHHPIFSGFERFRGSVPPGFHANFLGALRRNAFTAGLFAARGWQFPPSGLVETSCPELDEESLEWIDVLEAVLAAEQRFTMLELGAGFGRWLVNAAMAARQRRPDLELALIGVEAEPTRFQWMKQHFEDNGMDPGKHRLIEAAVDAEERTVDFYVGMPDQWWGQSMTHLQPPIPGCSVRTVKTVTLERLLNDLDLVDLIDLDIEGAELAVLSGAIGLVNEKVKRLHIGTHSRTIEQGLRALFWDNGWYKRTDYETGRTESTPWGEVSFENGVQTWINPRLAAVSASELELGWLESSLRSADRRSGRLLDETRELREALGTLPDEVRAGRAELHELRTVLQESESARTNLATELSLARGELSQLREALGLARGRVAAMESSKFWKLRRRWFRLRDLVGLGEAVSPARPGATTEDRPQEEDLGTAVATSSSAIR